MYIYLECTQFLVALRPFFAAKIPYWLGSSTTTQVARIKSTKPVKRPHHKANGEPSPAASAGLPSNNPTSIGVSVGSPAGSLDVDWDWANKNGSSRADWTRRSIKTVQQNIAGPDLKKRTDWYGAFTSNRVGNSDFPPFLESANSYALNGIVFQIPCTHYGRTSTGWSKNLKYIAVAQNYCPKLIRLNTATLMAGITRLNDNSGPFLNISIIDLHLIVGSAGLIV